MNNSATIQAQIQGFVLAHPTILSYLWTAAACKGAVVAESKLQDFHDTWQQQGIWEKSGEDIDSVAEARGLKSD